MVLLPIKEQLEENKAFLENPLCQESLYASIDFYKKVGFQPPWICYYVQREDVLVGSAAFKGPPKAGVLEIAYGTFEPFRQQGVGAQICRLLVETALRTDPMLNITARTLPEENFSTRILRRNGFQLMGLVYDLEDGDVWEWLYQK